MIICVNELGTEHGRLVRKNEFFSNSVRSERPADPEPGSERLREGAEVDHAILFDRAHRVRRRGVEVEQAVRVVLEHEDVVRARDLENLEAALPRQRHAGRVAERRHRVQELDAPARGLQARDVLAQRLGNEAELVRLDVVDLRLERLEHDERGDVAGRLGEHDVARVEEDLGDELERVLGPGRDDDVIHARPDALERHHLEDVLAQPRKALAGAVLERDGTAVAA